MGIGGAVGRTIEKTAPIVHGCQRATFSRDKRVTSETLREGSVEAHERALGVVAAQGVEGIAGCVERPNLLVAGPESVFSAAGAEHAHAQTAVLFLISGN